MLTTYQPVPTMAVVNRVTEPKFKSGFVPLWGRPNVGKSTLINRLVGEKVAIISPKPQTTRNRIVGVMERNNVQAVLFDTPGIHEPRHKLGEFLVNEARDVLPDADVVLFVVDAAVPPSNEDETATKLLRSISCPIILILNKGDLLNKIEAPQRREEYESIGAFAATHLISAVTGNGVSELTEHIVNLLPDGPAYYPEGTFTDVPDRFVISEMIREASLASVHQEVPYGIAVLVEELKPRRDDLTYVSATIHVERASQKGIVVGEGGRVLKTIGQVARKQIERYLDTRIYLDLWVKVAHKWRKDDNALRRFGYFVKPDGSGRQ